MNTTSIFVELVVVGLHTALWIGLIILAFVGYQNLNLEKVFTLNLALPILAITYILGILMDRASDIALTAQDDRLRSQYDLRGRPGFLSMRFYILSKSSDVYAQLEYTRSRLRIARASILNFAFTTFAAVLFVWFQLGQALAAEYRATACLTAAIIGALHDWAWGITNTLTAYEAYAWGRPGDLTVMQAPFRYTRTAVITTGIEAGSLEASGTYLHSLADAYSHQDCIAAMDSLGMPWATHTITRFGDTSVPACDYDPSNYSSTDVHGREFFTYTESYSHTDAALLAVYAELVSRSLRRGGHYMPLGLDTRLTSITDTPTLSGALYSFVHDWDYDQPTNRRAYADLISSAALAQRVPIQRVYLPVVIQN